MTSDEELMAAIRAGDRQAYATVVKTQVPAISRYIQRMLGSRNEVEDIAQETFLRLWTQAHTWQAEKANLSTWLHRIAHNLCIDFLRRDKAALSSEYEDDHASIDNPERDLSRQVQVQQLEEALQALPERQRSALLLTHYQGLSNREVADIMAVSVDALESILARARRSLKVRLQQAEKVNTTLQVTQEHRQI